MTGETIRGALDAIGNAMGPDVLAACSALFDAEQIELMQAIPAVLADAAYGEHPRHRLDLYRTGENKPGGALRPVVLFVHGGGFRMGDKGGDAQWPNASVGRMVAQRGMLGAVINYRLAPDHDWPAGGQDVLAALDWLTNHAAAYGGDPHQIVLMGTSAGSVHVATALQLRPTLAVRGLILLSGLYGYTDLDDKDLAYFGDPSQYADRMSRHAVVATELPMLIATAQHDPLRFQREFSGLLADRLERHGCLPRLHYGSGHNHYSLAMHLGTADQVLANAIADFIAQCCADTKAGSLP